VQLFVTTVMEQDGVCVLQASGEIDMATSTQFAAALTKALTPGATLLLDLSAVSFMDSQGLNVLLTAARGVEAIGARFSIVASPAVSRVLEITGAGLALDVRLDRTEAIKPVQA